MTDQPTVHDPVPMDLRHWAVMLDYGSKKAGEYQDAALSSALSAMAEIAVVLHQNGGDPTSMWHLPDEFAKVVERYT